MDIKKKLIKIYNSALKKTSPRQIVRDNVLFKENRLHIKNRSFHFEKIFVAGFGKASCTMAQGIEDSIPAHLIEGAVITKYGHSVPLSKIQIFEASHPLPDENSLKATQNIIQYLAKATKNDLVIFLISGGGSSLLEMPRKGITLLDFQKITDLLISSGACINEINIIRKHLSSVKGGGLACLAHPAPFISLILSDVIGSDLSSIASGPTVRDPSTFEDCRKIIEKYNLTMKTPEAVKDLILKGKNGQIEDTPSPEDSVFKDSFNFVLSDNEIFCKIISDEAKKETFNSIYLKTPLTTSTAEELIKGLPELIKLYTSSSPKLLILGGEITLNITEDKTGLGGRNQHLTLLFTRDILPLYPDIFAMFASTDGTDGPTDASGGFSNRYLLEKCQDRQELERSIENYDSYNFLRKYDELFITGPTGNNVNDVSLIYLPAYS
ncbi:MAG TPA: DUF4147 domain-containing protein [Candidatus Eremiobacteraeota bacterium]|nr:MAG: putative hydroxypyruvate reductase [bacterium ADurb.Bin363]HPZ08185.1 DUF4147 domain-containing protein [Candidatus Eremiobacteraeota bacterium]